MTNKQEIALLLRQRAYGLREGAVGNEDDPEYAGNLPCARELESIATSVESGDAAETPLAESVWLHECTTLRELVTNLRQSLKAAEEAKAAAEMALDMGSNSTAIDIGRAIALLRDRAEAAETVAGKACSDICDALGEAKAESRQYLRGAEYLASNVAEIIGALRDAEASEGRLRRTLYRVHGTLSDIDSLGAGLRYAKRRAGEGLRKVREILGMSADQISAAAFGQPTHEDDCRAPEDQTCHQCGSLTYCGLHYGQCDRCVHATLSACTTCGGDPHSHPSGVTHASARTERERVRRST